MDEPISKDLVISNPNDIEKAIPVQSASANVQEIQNKEDWTKPISFKKALTKTFISSIPQIGSQFVMMSGNFIGVVFISQLSSENLAASNLSYSIQNWFIATVNAAMSMGMSNAARKKGAGRKSEMGGVLHITWLLSLLVSIPIIGGLLAIKPILLALHQDPTTVELTAKYFNGFVWGVPAQFLLSNNRQFTGAAGLPSRGLGFAIFYQVIDTLLSGGLVFGKAYLPALGFAGLAYSNSIAVWLTFILSTLYLAFAPDFRGCGVTKLHLNNFWQNFWETAKANIAMGLKAGVELGSMAGASLMIGAMSTIQQAAQEAAYQYVFIINPFIFGVFDMTNKFIGLADGAKSLHNIKMYANAGIVVSASMTLACLALFITIPNLLLRAFVDPNSPDNKQIMDIAKWLLLINGIGQLADCARTILLGSFNSIKDYFRSTLYIIFTLVGIFVPLAYGMGFPGGLEAPGVMMARSISIAAGGAILAYLWSTVDKHKPTAASNALPVPNSNINSDEKQPLLVNQAKKRTCDPCSFWFHRREESTVTDINPDAGQAPANPNPPKRGWSCTIV